MTSPGLRLHYSAISDVGRVRKDNQDSGYAGPWLLTVCDGVGGAARGDIASSTAVSELRELDAAPPTPAAQEPATLVDTPAVSDADPADDSPSTPSDGTPAPTGGRALLDRVAHQLHEAHVRIGRLVDDDPALNGTSTTATVALFDGARLGIGHVGDSRAYLFRDGEISQLTTDHTFVQSLIDEGRITEAEARTHPHRNLILKALDGIHEAEPDLFVLEVVAGDRLLLCSDGASGVLDDGRLADVLSMGTPDFAAVELVRASLEAGSSDNVTCLVADVVTAEQAEADPAYAELEPMLVGAAAELRRRSSRTGGVAAGVGSLFRGHRSGDTGELPPIEAEIPDDLPFAVVADPPLDPEAARYAPRPPRRFQWAGRLLGLAVVVGVVWIAGAAAWSWSQSQYYVASDDGRVAIFRGVDASLPGLELSRVHSRSEVEVASLCQIDRDRVADGISASDLDAAEALVQQFAELAAEQETQPCNEDEDTGTDTGESPAPATGTAAAAGSTTTRSGR